MTLQILLKRLNPRVKSRAAAANISKLLDGRGKKGRVLRKTALRADQLCFGVGGAVGDGSCLLPRESDDFVLNVVKRIVD
ncbi:hypothetical protein BCD48_42770 [Pseudofrankia sp. BMG5.36]|nr:hypothetical protein BCD48_42770 [Pseudofrankia sp. BMG5.36]